MKLEIWEIETALFSKLGGWMAWATLHAFLKECPFRRSNYWVSPQNAGAEVPLRRDRFLILFEEFFILSLDFKENRYLIESRACALLSSLSGRTRNL